MGHRRFQGAQPHDSGAPMALRRPRGPLSEFTTRALVVAGLVLAGIITLWLLYQGINVFLTIFGAVIMAVLLRTIADPIARYARVPDWAAVLIAVTGILALFIAGGWLMAKPVAQQFEEMAIRLPEAIERFRAQFLSYGWLNRLMDGASVPKPGTGQVVRQATHVFQITLTAGAAVVIVLFLAIYMAASPKTYVQGVVRLMPVGYRPRARKILRESYRMLRIWLLTKLISMAFVAVCVTIGLWLMNVPLALALGIVAGILEFIPTVGPLLSAIPAVLLGFVDSPMTAVYVALLYVVVQWVQNHITNPLLQQKTLSLPPALTLGLVALLGTFFGFPGLLLSGPLSVVVVVLVRMLYIEDMLERGRRRRVAEVRFTRGPGPGDERREPPQKNSLEH